MVPIRNGLSAFEDFTKKCMESNRRALRKREAKQNAKVDSDDSSSSIIEPPS